MGKRERRLSMLINDEEHDMLEKLADAEGVTVSTFIRQLTRRTFAHRFPAAADRKAHPRAGR
jgi:hypothetical protein